MFGGVIRGISTVICTIIPPWNYTYNYTGLGVIRGMIIGISIIPPMNLL